MLFSPYFKKDLIKHGALLSVLLTVSVLPARLFEGQANDPVNLAGSQCFIILLCLACWLSILYCFQNLSFSAEWQKITSSLLCSALFSVIFYYAINPLFEDFPVRPIKTLPWHVGFIGLLCRGFIIGGLMYPIARYFIKEQEVLEDKIALERLNRKNIISNLSFLQQQTDNHFMLNSLHILGEGIEEEWGKHYISRLCNVYSYLLDGAQANNVITVNQEVEFIESYIHLLKVRFEKGIEVIVNLNHALLKRKIPPLSLQTLVENAVKHNIVSQDHPLRIEIFSEEDNIIVRNNVQLRSSGTSRRTTRTGIGLQNLRERYRLIARASVLVTCTAHHYDVKIVTIS